MRDGSETRVRVSRQVWEGRSSRHVYGSGPSRQDGEGGIRLDLDEKENPRELQNIHRHGSVLPCMEPPSLGMRGDVRSVSMGSLGPNLRW